jgi:hypothetical protein
MEGVALAEGDGASVESAVGCAGGGVAVTTDGLRLTSDVTALQASNVSASTPTRGIQRERNMGFLLDFSLFKPRSKAYP